MARKFLTPIDLNKLELQNAAIQNLAIAPGSPNVGQIYYDTDDNKIKVWTGSSWDNVGSSQEEIEDYIDGLLTAGNGINLTYDDGGNLLTITNTGVLSVSGTANEITVSASAGDVTISLPDTINADTTGNAATATALQTARTISISGDASASASFDGTGNIDLVLAIDSNSAVSSLTGTANEVEVSASVGAVTIGLPSTINVDVTGDLTGNADTATALETARAISISGPVSGSASFDGTSDITITVAQGNDSITLGTHTTGNYVASVTGTANEIEVSGTGEGAAVTIGLPNDVSVTGNLTVGGDLTISGSATYVNTEIIQLADNTIILNSNATGSATEDAGIEVERGSDPNVSVLWDESEDSWILTNDGTNFAAIARKVAANVGNGASASFTIVHNLGTQDVTVQIYDNATYETVEADVVRGNGSGGDLTTKVTVTFAVAPANNAYRVVIVG